MWKYCLYLLTAPFGNLFSIVVWILNIVLEKVVCHGWYCLWEYPYGAIWCFLEAPGKASRGVFNQMPHLIKQNGVTCLYVYPRASHSQKREKGFRLVKSTPVKLRVVQLPLKTCGLGTPLAVQWLRLCFQYKGHEFDPWSANQDPACGVVQLTINKQLRFFFFFF